MRDGDIGVFLLSVVILTPDSVSTTPISYESVKRILHTPLLSLCRLSAVHNCNYANTATEASLQLRQYWGWGIVAASLQHCARHFTTPHNVPVYNLNFACEKYPPLCIRLKCCMRKYNLDAVYTNCFTFGGSGSSPQYISHWNNSLFTEV